ncbi:MAG: amidohydrolase, partial [bacterium]|nr:amidohydrolase [bacterium]
MDQFTELIDSIFPQVADLRRDLHANPELSRAEHDTSRKVRALLEGLPGIEVLPPLMDTDVVALLNAGRAGPCLALRADLDALPIDEETDVAYKSTVPGVMHACGHDGHTAILVGTAMVLSKVRDTLPGRVKFIFQPDEEQGGGGGLLCERGVLEDELHPA